LFLKLSLKSKRFDRFDPRPPKDSDSNRAEKGKERRRIERKKENGSESKRENGSERGSEKELQISKSKVIGNIWATCILKNY